MLTSLQGADQVQDLHLHLRRLDGLCHLRGGYVLDTGREPGRLSLQGHALQHRRDIRKYVSSVNSACAELTTCLGSVCLLELAGIRPLAHVHELHPVYALISDLCQYPPNVSRPLAHT